MCWSILVFTYILFCHWQLSVICLYWSSLTFFFVTDNCLYLSILVFSYILLCHWQLSVLVYIDIDLHLHSSLSLTVECVGLYWSSLTFFFVIDNWVCWSVLVFTYIVLCHWQLSVLVYIDLNLHSSLSLAIECVCLYWSSLTLFFVIDNWVCLSILILTDVRLCHWQLSVVVYIRLHLHSSLSLTIECNLSIMVFTYILLCHWQLFVFVYIGLQLHSSLSLAIECLGLYWYWSSLTFFFVIDNWVCWSILIFTYIVLCHWQLSVLVYIGLHLHCSLPLTIECVGLYCSSLTLFFVIDNWVCWSILVLTHWQEYKAQNTGSEYVADWRSQDLKY